MSEKTKRLIRYPSRIPVLDVNALKQIVGKEHLYDYAVILFKAYGARNVGDDIGADYYWDNGSTLTGDDWDIVQPIATLTGSPGRWIRIKKVEIPARTMWWSYSIPSSTPSLSLEFTHDWGTKKVIVQVIRHNNNDTAYDDEVQVNIGRSSNKIKITFAQPPVPNDVYWILATEIK